MMLRERLQDTRYSDPLGDSRASTVQNNVGWQTGARQPSNRRASVGLKGGEARWNLAFLGLMAYTFIEYSRLPEMYPIFQPFQLGKVAIAVAAVGCLVSPRVSGRPSSRGLDLAVSIFVIGNFLSACFASNQDQVWGGFLDVLVWGIVYFLMTRVLVNSWQVRVLLFLVLLLNLKFAQHTIHSYFVDRSAGVADMQIIMSGGAGEGTSSFFGNVADLGLAMAVVWGIVWALLLGKTEKSKLARFFLIICFVTFLLAILFCGSRGAVVGAGAVVLTAVARSRKRIGAVLLALIFVLGVWFVLPDASKVRFQNAWAGNDANASSRILFWKIGLGMFRNNPIFGVGPANFAEVNPLHYVSHSLYIQVLAESGLLGAVSLAGILILMLRLNARTRKHALASDAAGQRSFEYCLALGLDLGLVGYLTSGAFLSVLYYPHLWILLGLSVAVHSICLRKQPQEAAESEKAVRKFALARA